MRTARQSGWSMTEQNGLVTLYNDFGDYAEAWANVDGQIRTFSVGETHDILDFPRSVVTLIALWLDVQIPV